MQARLAFSKYILNGADFSSFNTIPSTDARIDYLADLLGVAEWSTRTKVVLRTALNNPMELVLIGINAPEYVVNA